MNDLLVQLKQAVGFNPLAWVRSVPQMRRLAREFAANTVVGTGSPEVLVVVSPWIGSAVPWFSLAVGLMLSAEGARVTFAVDDYRFGPNALRFQFVVSAIRLVMSSVGQRYHTIHLSKLASVAGGKASDAETDRLARLNTTWAMRGEMIERGRQAYERKCRSQIERAYGAIGAVFRDRKFDLLFMPGGVYGDSGIWALHARNAGVRVASYDSGGYETVMLAVDGFACQLQDVPRAFHNIRARCVRAPQERVAALAAATAEIEQRRQGVDAFESQIRESGRGGEGLKGGILVALNSSWDAAALGPHMVFDGNTSWIVETVRHLLTHSQVPVIVRQHPVERLALARTTDDYRSFLQQHFGANPRLHFIAAEDPVNTYALLEQVAAVVVHSSTVGLEAVAFGLPVVTGSNAYYSNLGFVWRADSLDCYKEMLVDAAEGKLKVTQEMRDDARLCFYITQCCNWVFSEFNPADHIKWSQKSLMHWRAEPAIQRMIQSLLTNTPVAELNHVARWGQEARFT